MHVRDIMDEKHPYIYEDELATKARALIRDLSLRILPVTDKNKKLSGIVSRFDAMIISSSISPISVKGIMTSPKTIATMEDDAARTVKEMIGNDEWYAPIVTSDKDKTYRGVLGLEKFIEPIVKTNPEKLLREVSEIMTTKLVTCSPEDEVDNVWRLMQAKSLSGIPVVKADKAVGIITQKDFLDSGTVMPTFESAKGRYRSSSKIGSIMKTGVLSVKPETKVIKVAKAMVSKNIGRVLVNDENGKLVGIVDREDIARQLVR